MLNNDHKFTKKDYESKNEVRWCPGCGDYAILACIQKLCAELNLAPENQVFVSGIGCSSRFPYYMNAYGFHTIHGRAPTIATGIKMANPDLNVWIITGDGDGLSIGANHLLHIMRRNVNVNILLFNNQIYGLTKGQFSPTSNLGHQTKTTPMGSIDSPLSPIKIALGANCSFVGRGIDVDAQRLTEVIKAGLMHNGTSFIEIYQNCNVFNDGAFDSFAPKLVRDEKTVAINLGNDLAKAFEYSQITMQDNTALPVGIFYQTKRPVYEQVIANDLQAAQQSNKNIELEQILQQGSTWQLA